MKIKITSNVVHNGKILKKDSVADLPEKEADALIKGKHAEEHKTEPAKKDEPSKK